MKSSHSLWGLGVLVLAVSLGFQLAAEDYKLGPDSQPQAGVPKGEVTHYTFNHSKIFPGTERDYWVYVPKQHDPAKPACLMVFQDGGGYVNDKGAWRVPIVFDNLIHKGGMPVTIGVFVNPGVVPAARPGALARYNRSYEYDGLGDSYARFLLEELLPEVAKNYNLSPNPNDRAIAGSSSGAIAAFTAAWERPDAFRRVFSTVGTFVGLRGGDVYPTLIRKMEPKPIRIFLQDGDKDLNIYGGNWFLANQAMLSALEYAGYDVNHAWGTEGHNSKHGGAILPDALRWLWRDYPKPIAKPMFKGERALDVLIPGEDWRVVSAGHKFTEGPAANTRGEVFFTDIPNSRIHKIGLDGKVTVFAENTGAANGLMFGPDGRLYACANGKQQIVAYDAAGHATVIAEGVNSNDLAVSHKGEIYFSDPGGKKVWFINAGGQKRVVDTGIAKPNGVILSPDQTLLLVADTDGQFVYSLQTRPDGSLAFKQRYFDLHVVDGSMKSGADGMTVDTLGRLYVATEMGVQICDQAGRVNGILAKPQRAWLSNLCFGGPGLDVLYATCGDKVYRRKLNAKGVLSFPSPITPPKPRL